MKCLYLVVRSLDPTGTGPGTLDEPLEACPQRLRHHVRRPPLPEADEPSPTMKQPDPLHRSSDRLDWNATQYGCLKVLFL